MDIELFYNSFSNDGYCTELEEYKIKRISEINSHTVLITVDSDDYSIDFHDYKYYILMDTVISKYPNCDIIIIKANQIFYFSKISKDNNNFIALSNNRYDLFYLYKDYASHCKNHKSIKLPKIEFRKLILGSDKLSDYIREYILKYNYYPLIYDTINRCIRPRCLYNALYYDIIKNDRHIIRVELNFNENVNIYYLKNNLQLIKLYCKSLSGKRKIIPGSITISKVNNEFLYRDTYRVCIDFEK